MYSNRCDDHGDDDCIDRDKMICLGVVDDDCNECDDGTGMTGGSRCIRCENHDGRIGWVGCADCTQGRA